MREIHEGCTYTDGKTERYVTYIYPGYNGTTVAWRRGDRTGTCTLGTFREWARREVDKGLLRCPFCGGQPALDANQDGKPYVRCQGCCARTAVGRDEGEAKRAWNKRVV